MVSKSHETDTSELLLANVDAVAAVQLPFDALLRKVDPIGLMAGRNRSDNCR